MNYQSNETIASYIQKRVENCLSQAKSSYLYKSIIFNYNDGFVGRRKVFEELNIDCGSYFHDIAVSKDTKRQKGCKRKSTGEGKQRRKKLRAIRKGFQDKERELEGDETYKSGAF